MKIKFVKTSEDAILPKRNHEHITGGDAGFDLFASMDMRIPAGGSEVVPVGLKLAYVSPGYWFRIEPRSGLGFKKSIQPHLGIIDNGYRGDLGVKLYNFGEDDVDIKKGDGIAQFIVYKMIHCEVEFTEEVAEAERGEKGFGSSDKTS